MRALITGGLILICCSVNAAEVSRNNVELIVDIEHADVNKWSSLTDSIVVSVYVENVNEPISGFDLWLELDHVVAVRFLFDSIWYTPDSMLSDSPGNEHTMRELPGSHDTSRGGIALVAGVSLDGCATEDWEYLWGFLYREDLSLMELFGIADTGSGIPPLPAGVGPHLLAKVILELSDSTGYTLDSLCNDDSFYDQFGVTEIGIWPRSFFVDADGHYNIGWSWSIYCRDSICIEWDADSCIAWECTEWDSIYVADTSKIELNDGLVTAGCVCDVLIGDAIGDSYIDIDDIVYLIDYIFCSGTAPRPYNAASGDGDCSCSVDVEDAVYMILHIFQGGPSPCHCTEWVDTCGLLY